MQRQRRPVPQGTHGDTPLRAQPRRSCRAPPNADDHDPYKRRRQHRDRSHTNCWGGRHQSPTRRLDDAPPTPTPRREAQRRQQPAPQPATWDATTGQSGDSAGERSLSRHHTSAVPFPPQAIRHTLLAARSASLQRFAARAPRGGARPPDTPVVAGGGTGRTGETDSARPTGAAQNNDPPDCRVATSAPRTQRAQQDGGPPTDAAVARPAVARSHPPHGPRRERRTRPHRRGGRHCCSGQCPPPA